MKNKLKLHTFFQHTWSTHNTPLPIFECHAGIFVFDPRHPFCMHFGEEFFPIWTKYCCWQWNWYSLLKFLLVTCFQCIQKLLFCEPTTVCCRTSPHEAVFEKSTGELIICSQFLSPWIIFCHVRCCLIFRHL